MSTVKLRYTDKCNKCGFFLAPGDGPILLGMPNIELLNILRITLDIIGKPHESRTFDSLKLETSDSPHCRTNKALQIKTDRACA